MADNDKSKTYTCEVSPVDSMLVYETVDGCGPCIAMVMTNGREQKISVLLKRDEAIRLQKQLNTFTDFN